MSPRARRLQIALAVALAAGSAATLTSCGRAKREAAAQRTVATFMNTVVEITGLMWSAEDRKRLGPGGADVRAAQALEIRRLSQGALRLFRDEDFGRAALAVLLLFKYGPVEVGEATLRGSGAAAVPVSFTPGDVFGMSGARERLGIGEDLQLRTLRLQIVLERRGADWLIAGTEGDLAYEIRQRAGAGPTAPPRP